MNNKIIVKEPLVNIERHPVFLLANLLFTAALLFLTYYTLFRKEQPVMHPLFIFLIVPAAVISFQTLWYLLNPFLIITEDGFEIKYSIFFSKHWHFSDIQKAAEFRSDSFKIVYTDGEIEKISLFGIRPAHRTVLKEELNKQIDLIALKRNS